MIKANDKLNFTLSDIGLDRREDIYALQSFGKIVNRYLFSDPIYSIELWKYLRENFNIKKENTICFCEYRSDVKNRTEKFYKYIIEIEKPHKIIFIFHDEEKSKDPMQYDDDLRDKINDFMIYFDSESHDAVSEIMENLKKFTYLPQIGKTFYVISTSLYNGYELRPANIKDRDFNLEYNYGPDFVEKHNEILHKMKSNKHGLFLFHGEAGTGKTTYIRKLVSELAESKTIIYVPSYFMMDIVNPELISFIAKFKNSILLLEDAEDILTSPKNERNQAVSNILNITDGLLNDHMDMQVIATFNTEKKVIDDALLRKGRLLVNYRFKKLTAIQATKLSKFIGMDKIYDAPKTLAEIYEETNGGKQLVEGDNSKKIGFGQ